MVRVGVRVRFARLYRVLGGESEIGTCTCDLWVCREISTCTCDLRVCREISTCTCDLCQFGIAESRNRCD